MLCLAGRAMDDLQMQVLQCTHCQRVQQLTGKQFALPDALKVAQCLPGWRLQPLLASTRTPSEPTLQPLHLGCCCLALSAVCAVDTSFR